MASDVSKLKRDYLNCLEHAIVAYKYCEQAIPTDAMFVAGQPVIVGRFEFRKPENATSMRIELGWAFFVRLEATLEAYVSRLGLKLRHDYSISEHLVKSGREIPERFAGGLRGYRELRNTLHHGDGDATLLNRLPQFLDVPAGCEPQLFREHIEKFNELFRWLGEELAATVP